MSMSFSSIVPRFPDFSALTSRDPSASTSALLLNAITNGNTFEVERLVAKSKNLIHQPLSDGELPLHAAVRLGRVGIVLFLMKEGCDSSMPDSQGMTPIDYAVLKQDLEMLRLLLPPKLLQKISTEKNQLDAFDFAQPEAVDALRQVILSNKEKIKSHFSPTNLDDAIYYGTDEQALSFIVKSPIGKHSDFNQCDARGISPMHIAAALGRANLLQQMAARGGDLFAKSANEIAPADLLLNLASEKDPQRFDKAKLILTFIKVGSLVAQRYISPLSPALFLFGAELILNYQVSQRLNLQSFSDKVLYWASSVVPISVHLGLSNLPGVGTAWDLFRVQAVCRDAFSKIHTMYHNYKYDPRRSLAHMIHQTVDASATVYQVRGTLQKVTKFLLNDSNLLYQDLQKELDTAKTDAKVSKTAEEAAKASQKATADDLAVKNQELQKCQTTHGSGQLEYERLSKLQKDVLTLTDPIRKDDLCRAVYEQDLFNQGLSCKKEVNRLNEIIRIMPANHEKDVRESNKLHREILSKKPLKYLLNDYYSPLFFDQAVCMLYGDASMQGGVLKKGFPKNADQLNSTLSEKYQELTNIFNDTTCKKARLSELCENALKKAQAARNTIFDAVLDLVKPINKDKPPLRWDFTCKAKDPQV